MYLHLSSTHSTASHNSQTYHTQPTIPPSLATRPHATAQPTRHDSLSYSAPPQSCDLVPDLSPNQPYPYPNPNPKSQIYKPNTTANTSIAHSYLKQLFTPRSYLTTQFDADYALASLPGSVREVRKAEYKELEDPPAFLRTTRLTEEMGSEKDPRKHLG
jgi:hypothetical protein